MILIISLKLIDNNNKAKEKKAHFNNSATSLYSRVMITDSPLLCGPIENSLIHRWLFIKDLLTCLEIPSQEAIFQFGSPKFVFARVR
jgi:hypothetical protein